MSRKTVKSLCENLILDFLKRLLSFDFYPSKIIQENNLKVKCTFLQNTITLRRIDYENRKRSSSVYPKIHRKV